MREAIPTKKFAIIDGKSVFYRAFMALPNLSTKDGIPTGGVFGFATIALEMNNKPRKRLKWHTPLEVYDFLVQNPNKQLDLTQVAFGSRI